MNEQLMVVYILSKLWTIHGDLKMESGLSLNCSDTLSYYEAWAIRTEDDEPLLISVVFRECNSFFCFRFKSQCYHIL